MTSSLEPVLAAATARHKLNRLPAAYGGGRIFGEPLVGVACGTDPILQEFKRVVAPEHLTPGELWTASGFPVDDALGERLRIVSVAFPYEPLIREAGRKATAVPPEVYCVARNFADALIRAVLQELVDFLLAQGARAMSATYGSAVQILERKEGVRRASNWSERHVAFACGLGTFGLHRGLITERGCNVRLGSVLTDAQLEVTRRKGDDPWANCLHYSEGKCAECLARCPAGALAAGGFDPEKCLEHERKVRAVMLRRGLKPILKPIRQRIDGRTVTTYSVGCALCRFGVPCSDANPRRTSTERCSGQQQ